MVNNDNLADAYGLARVAYEIAKPVSVKRHQLGVVKSLLKVAPRKKKASRRKTQFKDAI